LGDQNEFFNKDSAALNDKQRLPSCFDIRYTSMPFRAHASLPAVCRIAHLAQTLRGDQHANELLDIGVLRATRLIPDVVSYGALQRGGWRGGGWEVMMMQQSSREMNGVWSLIRVAPKARNTAPVQKPHDPFLGGCGYCGTVLHEEMEFK
jgi:hypothetical protein